MVEREYFNTGENRFFHVCTNGNALPWMFKDNTDFIIGINRIAICRHLTKVNVISYVLMDNHIHCLLQGTMPQCKDFINKYKQLTGKYIYSRHSITGHLRGLESRIIPIEDEENLLAVLAYIDRNPTVAGYRYLPSEYPWGSARYLFRAPSSNAIMGTSPDMQRKSLQNMTRESSQNVTLVLPPEMTMGHSPDMQRKSLQNMTSGIRRIAELPVRERYSLLGTRIELPQEWMVDENGMIIPSSFWDPSPVESIFKTPGRYLYFLSKKLEGDIDASISKWNSTFIPDKDLRAVVEQLAQSICGNKDIRTLTVSVRMAIARKLRYEYASTTKQIARLLHLDLDILKGYI